MSEVVGVKSALEKLEGEFKTQQEEVSRKVEKYGAESAEVKGLLEQLKDGLGEQMDSIKTKQEEMAVAINRSGVANEEGKQVDERAEAMQEFITKGFEAKSLSVGNDPQAGYLVTPQMGEMFDKTQTEFSPLRQLAEVVSISNADALERLVNAKGGVGAGWESEIATSSDTGAPSLEKQYIATHSMRASVYATTQLLEDASNVESWIMAEASENFASLSNAAFFNGDGVGKPRGLLTYAAGDVTQVDSGSATTFTTDGLLELMGTLKAPYRSGASFMANRSTIFQHLLTLTDAENRNYLVPDFRNGLQFRLVGTPLMEATDMPVVAADALALAYGDFKRGYTIVDRQGQTVLRDPYSAKPFIEFWIRSRVGGDVKAKEAIALQKISA
jgi:HK97 family phage major capsid protein